MPTISIVIPAWQEAPLITDAVQCAQRIGDEVIVVDGGSRDGTARLAEAAGARVILAPKGRGRQLQAGANVATGDILLFLHADVRLPPDARDAILEALSAPDVIGGNFLIRFLPVSWFTRLLAWANDIRRRLTRRYYGDSGIFVRRAVYFELGGFRDFPLMEDYEFSKRMERSGRCAYLRHVSVYVSARRFQGRELHCCCGCSCKCCIGWGCRPILLPGPIRTCAAVTRKHSCAPATGGSPRIWVLRLNEQSLRSHHSAKGIASWPHAPASSLLT